MVSLIRLQFLLVCIRVGFVVDWVGLSFRTSGFAWEIGWGKTDRTDQAIAFTGIYEG